VEVHHRTYGVDGAVAMARSRRGGHFDPAVVDAFVTDPEGVLSVVGDDPWSSAMSLAPDSEISLDEPGLDALVMAIGDFGDL
ncbi:LuxR family transcriptional regulator, partial [Streptomyces sp. SID10244]|nr:LuxR family transcriptional regulator [Streptomyces sp. SID10244]